MVLSLSSYEPAQSPVGLSESPLFHHQYSSYRDAIAGVGDTPTSQDATLRAIRLMYFDCFKRSNQRWLQLQTDASTVKKAHSKSLPDRQYIKIANNVIRSNQPISIGYPISLVNVRIPENDWSLPLDIQRISFEQSANACAVEQLKTLLI